LSTFRFRVRLPGQISSLSPRQLTILNFWSPLSPRCLIPSFPIFLYYVASLLLNYSLALGFLLFLLWLPWVWYGVIHVFRHSFYLWFILLSPTPVF
jgi:hypothetical protein